MWSVSIDLGPAKPAISLAVSTDSDGVKPATRAEVSADSAAVSRRVARRAGQEYVARRLQHGTASRRRFVRASVRIFLETDADRA